MRRLCQAHNLGQHHLPGFQTYFLNQTHYDFLFCFAPENSPRLMRGPVRTLNIAQGTCSAGWHIYVLPSLCCHCSCCRRPSAWSCQPRCDVSSRILVSLVLAQVVVSLIIGIRQRRVFHCASNQQWRGQCVQHTVYKSGTKPSTYQ